MSSVVKTGSVFVLSFTRRLGKVLILVFALSLFIPAAGLSHEDTVSHLDPEMLSGWLTWIHLTIQWVHLVAFALWLGLTAGVLLLGVKPRLDHLLYSAWILFLIMLATGTYNMEWSAGIPETPTLLLLPVLKRVPYGITYTIILNIKLGLYALTVIMTLVLTGLYLHGQVDKGKLQRIFLFAGTLLGVLITLTTALVLLLHEAADLWPTALHSMGGVLGPEGPRGRITVELGNPPPNDFRLLANPAVWIDISVRWIHLLGFGLWVGGSAIALVFGQVSPRRFLWYSWTILIIQICSGIASIGHWTPFYLPPYVWNLDALSHVNFGRTYTLFMAVKHLLVILTFSLLMDMTVRYRRVRNTGKTDQFNLQPFVFVYLFLGLVIGYLMIIMLLLHEGVDHAL